MCEPAARLGSKLVGESTKVPGIRVLPTNAVPPRKEDQHVYNWSLWTRRAVSLLQPSY